MKYDLLHSILIKSPVSSHRNTGFWLYTCCWESHSNYYSI